MNNASRCFRDALDKCELGKYYAVANDRENPKYKNNPRKLRNYNLISLRKYFESKVYDSSGDGVMSSRLLHHEKVDTTNKHYLAISKDKKKDVINEAFKPT